MKKNITLLLLISSLNTIACPDLTGSYVCPTNDGEVSTLKLRRETTNGIVSFIFTENQNKEDRWIVDGKIRSLDSSPMDGVSNLKYSADCNSSELLIKMNGDLADLDTSIKINVELSLDDARNLSQRTSGSFSDGTPLPNAITHCYRNSVAPRKK